MECCRTFFNDFPFLKLSRDTKSWKQLDKLYSHSLTVVQLNFSPDGTSLLSVSRDRRWSVFKYNKESERFVLEATTDKKTGVHQRIIWCGAWTPDSKHFFTGSRCGRCAVWTRNGKPKEKGDYLGLYDASVTVVKNDSVTAAAFASELTESGKYYLAVGFDSGVIAFYLWSLEGWFPLKTFNNR